MSDKRSLFQKIADARVAGSNRPPVDPGAQDRYPTVFEFLTRQEASQDVQKDLASISIKMGVGEWVVELSDPGFAFSLTASSATLDDCLFALEASLTGPNPPIRPWKGELGQLRRKKRQHDQQS